MARVLALLAAVLLVVAAVLVRRELDEPDTGETDPDRPSAELVVACIPELERLCESLDDVDLRIEPPSATLAAPDVDAWVTFDPWPAIAQGALGTGEPVASTDLVLVTRAEGPAGDCTDWACAGAGRAAVPTSEAFGLLVLGNASLQWSERTRPGEPFARQELELPEYQAWLGGLNRTTRDPLADMLQLGPAGPPATAATAVDYEDRVRGSREEGNLTTSGTGTLGLVVAGRAASTVADRLQEPLGAQGWGPAGPSEGLPSEGLLRAMREVLR